MVEAMARIGREMDLIVAMASPAIAPITMKATKLAISSFSID
jgi:hypothetical protein